MPPRELKNHWVCPVIPWHIPLYLYHQYDDVAYVYYGKPSWPSRSVWLVPNMENAQ